MRLINKTILLVSPESWDHIFVSKHHYAIQLGGNGNFVYFLGPPVKVSSVLKTEYTNVFRLSYTGFPKGLRFYPSCLQRYIIRKKFRSLERICNKRFEIIWSFDNSVFFDFSALPKSILSICHIVDYSQNFQFLKAATTAKICLGVSPNLVERLKKLNPNTFLVPHGLSPPAAALEKVRLPGRNAIKALYAGNLDSIYLDKNTLFYLANQFSNVDFIFVGSGGTDWPRNPNCFFLGIIESFRLTQYLAAADVLLLLYNTEEFPDQVTNAHKILEYLYTGKVVVGCTISDYANKPGLLEMAPRPDIPLLFKRVISDLDFYNNVENMARRKNFARGNTYKQRILEIDALVKKFAG